MGNLTLLNRFPQISAEKLSELNQYKGDVSLLPSSNNNNWRCSYNEKISHLINYAEVITLGRARNPNPKYAKGLFISSQNHIIESKKNDILLNKFLYFFINKVGRKFYSFENTYPMFTKIDFLNTKFLFPSVKEQEKILKVLNNLDSLITLHQRECNFWNLKKFEIKIHRFFTRFYKKPKKYTHTWEQEKLGNLTLLNRFPQISAEKLSELNQYKGDVSLLPSSNNNNWRCSYNEKISHLINYAEVITLGRARNPNPKYAKGLFISSQNHIIESKKNDILLNKFLYFFINKVGRKFYSFENTYPMFTKIDFLNTKFLFPSVKEQEKILKVLNNLDSLITLHQRECNFWNLKKFKIKIHKFFTRFYKKPKKYTHTWEQWKVKDIFEITRGYVVSKKEILETKSGEYIYPIYSSQTINDGLLGYYKSYLASNAITWTTDGANAGTVSYRKGRFYATNVCGLLSTKAFTPNLYLAFALSSETYKHVAKVGNPKLMNNTMANIELIITSNLVEQSKISSLFSNLDSLITLHQRGYKWRENIWKKMIYCYTNTFKIE
uniref:Type I restriction modification DNA specificity domain-containing protein n=1 Tax=Mycoplasma feriruminatoris TaxID=1179777 RepID=A0A654IHU3_9MOLU|nr:hypothetical protein MF5294_00810 [Mycoplasma feriruminatoris]VZR98476.1 hypothetical protein MF5293_00806 [Mycoplasma feriruminatoris]